MRSVSRSSGFFAASESAAASATWSNSGTFSFLAGSTFQYRVPVAVAGGVPEHVGLADPLRGDRRLLDVLRDEVLVELLGERVVRPGDAVLGGRGGGERDEQDAAESAW